MTHPGRHETRRRPAGAQLTRPAGHVCRAGRVEKVSALYSADDAVGSRPSWRSRVCGLLEIGETSPEAGAGGPHRTGKTPPLSAGRRTHGKRHRETGPRKRPIAAAVAVRSTRTRSDRDRQGRLGVDAGQR